MNLGEMPLDTPEHIRMGWHMVTSMDWRRHKAVQDGKQPDPFLPGETELTAAMTRVQEAHERAGLGKLALPSWRQEPGSP